MGFCDHKLWHNVNVGAGDCLCYVIDEYLSRLEGCVAITCNTTFRHVCVCVCILKCMFAYAQYIFVCVLLVANRMDLITVNTYYIHIDPKQGRSSTLTWNKLMVNYL